MIRRFLSGLATLGETVLASAPWLPPEVQQARVIGATDNRPWPLPDRPWLLAQTWRDLLFAHWGVEPELVEPLLPAALPLDTYGGRAWIGITPFEVSGLRLRGAPPPPFVSRFPELNVRTYTTLDDRPGIYFLSLDAGSRLAVLGARRAYRLPYAAAEMVIRRPGDRFEYVSRRTAADMPSSRFEASYAPTGPPYRAEPGSLDYFLTERYCLYTVNEQGQPLRGEIQHPPWPLQPARATIIRNSMTTPWGLQLPEKAPLLHFSRLQNVLIWSLQPTGSD